MKQARLQGMWRLATGLIAGSLILAACAAPTPQTIIQTAVVTSVVRETQIVEQTQIVNQTQVVEVTAVPEAGDGPVYNTDVSGTVEMWHHWASPVRRNALRRVIAYCKTVLPNIEVIDTVKPFGDVWTANVAAVAAGSGMPDVIVSDRPTLPKDAADGVYQNLQEWATRDNVTREQFYDWSWDQTLFEGNTYGLPHETDVRVLFYNKNLFEAAGLDPNDPPETWAEIEAAAEALDVVGADGTYERIGFFPLWSGVGPDLWAYTNDADMIAEDGTPQINNENAVETVEWIKTFVDKYGGWEALREFDAANNAAAPNDSFMASKVAMRVDIFGYNSFLEFYRPRTNLDNDGDAGNDPRTDWGVALLPHGEDADPGTWSGGFSMSIPTGAANAEAAWEFIKCATGEEGQSSWARDTQAQPTNVAAAEDPVLAGSPNWAIVDEALATSTGGVFVQDYPNWTEQLNQRWELVWTGELTPQEALDEAQAAVMEQIGQ
jgi:multiple sugar transport system substrate-binding protein